MDEFEALQASRVAHQILIGALIQTHPAYEAFQLHLTRVLEQQLAPGGALGDTLDQEQKDHVRDVVEWTQVIRPLDPRTR